jgi:hypothetical protein
LLRRSETPRFAAAPVLALIGAVCASGHDLPLDRPYTLRNAEPAIVENESRRLILGDAPLAFTLPRPCADSAGESEACREPRRLSVSGPGESLGATLVAAEEFRAYGDALWSTEGGLILSGAKGPASFLLDARLFSGVGGGGNPSFDREDVDIQSDSVTGLASYSSYARYRGNLGVRTPVGVFTVARDALHWGPGLHHNLTFHQDAVPFNQLRYAATLGPLSVTSLFGELNIGDNLAYDEDNLRERNLYAHRYELRLGGDVVLGLSEQLILFEMSRPFLFTPIFPLFIAKTLMHESSNNGNIAFDAAWRLRGRLLVYGEFLLDDLESPSSLLARDYAQNKWGAMAGAHWAGVRGNLGYGAVAEAARLEPWVYAHFRPGTSQSANLGHPLGNPLGPNAQALTLKAYARHSRQARAYYGGLRADLVWKGRGPGSSLEDPAPADAREPKRFLWGVGSPDLVLGPEISYRGPWYAVSAGGSTADAGGAWARLQIRY